MSENQSRAAAYLRELQARREGYDDRAVGELQALFKRRERRPPERFEDSSFLYLRSFDGDTGVRPMSVPVFWHSPDLLLSPLTSVGVYTTQLNAGETYVVRAALRNRGDLHVPSAKVELYVTDPSLGFDTRFATNLTLGRVPTAWVPSNGSAAAEFTWTVPPAEAGHKCLFARTFSLSPLELPVDDFALDPRLDRHVAQQNLNIAGQGQAYAFNLIHAPNARLRLGFAAMAPEKLLALRHPVLADVVPFRDTPRGGWARRAGVEPVRGEHPVAVQPLREGFRVTSEDRTGMDLDSQRRLKDTVRKTLAAVSAGETTVAEQRDLFAAFRKMNTEARATRFTMRVPDIGLPDRAAVGLRITATDENADPPELAGGITLLIVGGDLASG